MSSDDKINALVEELTYWWHQQATNEISSTAQKAVEYGSKDLTDMGHVVARMTGREMTDSQATEFGIFWYALGKMSRWAAAYERGDEVSDDTLFDLGVYVRMAQRTRATGGWPGTES